MVKAKGSDEMNDEICPFCNPELFVIYGTCKKCGREGENPLFDCPVPIGIFTAKGVECMKKSFKEIK
jgi:hypothetical protein